jgi:hypothetical protein
MVVIRYVIRVFRILCVAVIFSRPFLCWVSPAVARRAARFGATTGPPLNRPPTGIVTLVSFAPHPLRAPLVSTVTVLIPTVLSDGRFGVSGPPIDGHVPLYAGFFLFGGAVSLAPCRQTSQGPYGHSGNVFYSSSPLGRNGSPTAFERTSICLCELAFQFQVVADFASASRVS